jgi:coenzyme F420-reducing hydrogenase beta subunit
MTPDAEGFAHPQIDSAKCVNCGLCAKACPVLVRPAPRKPLAVYAAKTKNEQLLLNSTSGGVFTELAHIVLSNGGVVCGAGWDTEFNVVHKVVESEDDLIELRGSKYVQSRLDGVYSQIKMFLSQGRQVLFTGMPCQCAAIRLKFGENSNLIICGLMCYSNTSSNIWRQYLNEFREKNGGEIKSIRFRDKSGGWRRSRFRISLKDGKEFSEYLYENLYWKIFCLGLGTLESCFHCKFRSGAHEADLIIGDYWGVEKIFPDIDYENGMSAVLVYTGKGEKLFARTELDMTASTYSDVLIGNPFLEKVTTVDAKKRKIFQTNVTKMPLQKAYNLFCYGPWYRRISYKGYRKLRMVVGAIVRKIRKG